MEVTRSRKLAPTRVIKLFNISYPIIQGGMVWVSGWRLASAVSNSGGLGLLGAGSMKSDLLREHIHKCKTATPKSFGVNIPLLRKDAEELINITIVEGVKIIFTSAGNPAKYIGLLKKNGIAVVHVVSNLKQALKAQSVGCDAIVAEGVEAGGHNGVDEIPITNLLTQLRNEIKIPIIVAGGIVNRFQIDKLLSLGAEGVQIGTLFASAVESSAHINYKEIIVKAKENDTALLLKSIGLIRAIKTPLTRKLIELEKRNATEEELRELLGVKRERLGIFEGDFENGILEAGVGVGEISEVKTVQEIFDSLIKYSF